MAPRAFYVDVDDTLIRSFGTKRVAIDATVEAIKALASEGAHLYLWSSGGAEYARTSAVELGIEGCFRAFLPKPDGLIDDVPVADWRLSQLHPSQCRGKSAAELLELLPHW